MLRPSIQELVFRKTIPHPKPNDPQNFFAHVERNLVPEVRLEVQTFYGTLNCLEAQYPGLDYTYIPHRKRLSRYSWHRRLFRIFDELRLTEHEILSLCQWEGTRSAKERYEADTKRTIQNTTADEVEPASPGQGPSARIYWSEQTDVMRIPESAIRFEPQIAKVNLDLPNDDDMDARASEQLNQQLQTFVEAISSDDDLFNTDAQWEQWMKEAMERNELDRDTLIAALRQGYTFTQDESHTAAFTPPVSSVGEYSARPTTSSGPPRAPLNTQRYHDLRAMLQDLQTANNQLSAENAALAMFLDRSQPAVTR